MKKQHKRTASSQESIINFKKLEESIILGRHHNRRASYKDGIIMKEEGTISGEQH